MELKRSHSVTASYSLLDLLGSDENALSKVFAYMLSAESDCYFEFLRYLGISIKNIRDNYLNANVVIQKRRNEGITDIELKENNKYHIIIECKIGKGRVSKQRTQYLTCFDKSCPVKILCILTQERHSNKIMENDIIIKNTSWLEIIEIFNKKKFATKNIVTNFLKFASKNYKMREIKEILIQDLGNKTEIERFKNFNIYRRDQTFGTPIYFAPYFSRNSGEIEGITNLSRILGILSLKPNDIDDFISDLESFTDDKNLIEDWIKGVKYGNDNKELIHTYYFLDVPLRFKSPLLKDGGKQKGRGKNWIAAMIPQNRCVRFTDFIQHIPELM